MKQRLARLHWAWILLGVAFVCKEYLIVAQLGRALHSGGARLVLCTAAIFAITSPLLCLRPGGVQIRRLLLLNLLLTFLSYGNLLHYRAFGGLSSVEQLGYMSQLGAVGGAVISLMQGKDLLLFVDTAALALIALFPSERHWPAMRRRSAWSAMATGVALLALTVTDSPRFATPWRGTTYIVGDIGIPTYHLLDVAKAVRKRALRERPDPSIVAGLRRHYEARWEEAPGAALAGAAKGRNVIVLQLESFQGFVEGLVVDGQEITPNLNALAKESLRFENFYHLAAAGRTSDAQFSMNCSLYPKHAGAAAFEYAGNDLYCLPERLEEQGYEATFIQSFRPDFWNRAAFNPVQGFSHSLSDRDFELDEKIGLGLSDVSFFRQVVEVVEELENPYYLFMLSLTNHAPFDFPELPRTLDLGEFEGTEVGVLLHTVHYTDLALGQLLGDLRERGILDEALLVVYGDHEAYTRRNANLDDLFPYGSEDELEWMRVEKRVPLLIRLPGGEGAGVYDRVGSQIDLAPTLLSLLGKERRGTFFEGSNLLAPSSEEPAAIFPDGSVLAADRVYLSPVATVGGARCVGPEGRELPLSSCADLAKRAEEAVTRSELILEADLLPELRQQQLAGGT